MLESILSVALGVALILFIYFGAQWAKRRTAEKMGLNPEELEDLD